MHNQRHTSSLGRTGSGVPLKLIAGGAQRICIQPLRKRTDTRRDGSTLSALIHRVFNDINLKARAPKQRFRLGSFPLNYKINKSKEGLCSPEAPLETLKRAASDSILCPPPRINRPFGSRCHRLPFSTAGAGGWRQSPASLPEVPSSTKGIKPEELRGGTRTLMCPGSCM